MATASPALEAKLNKSPGMAGMLGFGVVLLVGVVALFRDENLA